MKQAIHLIAVIILLFNSVNVSSQDAFFLFDGAFSGETHEDQVLSRGLRMAFLVDVVQALEKDFPCARVSYLGDISLCLAEMQLWGTPAFGNQDVGPKIKKMLNRLNNADYWVTYCIYPVSETMAIAELKCSDIKGKKLVQFSINMSIASIFEKDFIEPVKKFVKELSKYEICPYTGPINVEVKSVRTDTKTEKYPIYCNGMDGMYKLDRTFNKTSSASWNLNKTDKFQTSGTVIYNLREETKTEEQNDCYTCPSGRQGPRWYKENTLKTAKVEGLSNESVADDRQIEDARAEIIFLDNGTYTLQVKAASRKGDFKLKAEKHAEGTCSNDNPPPENITKKADIGLDEKFGPYVGTSLDKVLYHKETIIREDPVTREKTTISFEFNLKKE
jgi:hypothetical protein